MSARDQLIEQISTLAVVRGRVTLASGKSAVVTLRDLI